MVSQSFEASSAVAATIARRGLRNDLARLFSSPGASKRLEKSSFEGRFFEIWGSEEAQTALPKPLGRLLVDFGAFGEPFGTSWEPRGASSEVS